MNVLCLLYATLRLQLIIHNDTDGNGFAQV